MQDISLELENNRKASVNSQNTRGRNVTFEQGQTGQKSMSRKRANWIVNNNTCGSRQKVLQDIRSAQYDKLKTQFTIYSSTTSKPPSQNKTQEYAHQVITSRVKTHRQEHMQNEKINQTQNLAKVSGSVRFSQISPRIRYNYQQMGDTPNVMIGSPRSNSKEISVQRRREGSTSGIKENEIKLPLNELLKQKGGNVLTGSMKLGGPKLFIKQQQNQTNQSNKKQKELEFYSIEAIQQQQYLTQFPTFDNQQSNNLKNNKFQQSYDVGPSSKKDVQSSKASHLEMYKSIPLKNYKNTKIRGTANNKHNAHFKHLSNNYQNSTQFQTIGTVPGSKTQLGPFQFGALGESMPGTFDVNSDSHNFSIINQINQQFKTSRISPGNTNLTSQNNRQIFNDQFSINQGSSDTSYFKAPLNHFKQNKKQSVQPNATNKIISANHKLVSNQASVSQQQVPKFNPNFNAGQQFQGPNSLKNRYGRGRKSKETSTSNDGPSKKVIKSYSRSINNINQKLSIQNATSQAYGPQSVGSSIKQAIRTIQNEDENQYPKGEFWQEVQNKRNIVPLSSSLSNEKFATQTQIINESMHVNHRNQQLPAKRYKQKSKKIRVSGSLNPQSRAQNTISQSFNNSNVSLLRSGTIPGYPQPSAITSLYQSHNNKNMNRQQFNTINQAQQSTQNRFRNQNQTQKWSQEREQTFSSQPEKSNSMVKCLSPISILDNTQQPSGLLTGQRIINQTEQQQCLDPDMMLKNQKQYSQMFKKTENLTEQIRKVNKIQIKKRFKENYMPEKVLIQEAEDLIKIDKLEEGLKKYMEFIKLQPLNVNVHFQIGKLYKTLAKKSLSNENQNLEESILHFEQVIKHNEHNKKTIQQMEINEPKNPQLSKMKQQQSMSAEAIFDIIKIHIHHRDFYQASYELDRAIHFQYDKDTSKNIGSKLLGYRQFVQAVILLMKRKVEAAQEILKTLINNDKIKDKFFDFMILMYNAYASIIEKEYDSAIQDIKKANKIKEEIQDQYCNNFDSICSFNLQLADMLKSQNNKEKMIVQLSNSFPKNKDVIRYHAAFLINMQINSEMLKFQEISKNAEKDNLIKRLKNRGETSPLKKSQSQNMIQNQLMQESEQDDSENSYMHLFYQKVCTTNVDHPQKQIVIQNSIEILEKGLKISPRDRNLLLTRSHLLFYQHQFFEALCDIEAVIEIERTSSGEEEPNATDLLHQGRCHACLSMFKEAIQDFSKVIELDDEIFDAYFFRGKCAYLIGETSQAFLDFQKLILLQPKNPMVHAFAGNLLMTTGSYDDATKAFTNADKVHSCAFAIYQRARCFLALGDIKNSMNDLFQSCEMYLKNNRNNYKSEDSATKHPNPVALRDKNCLETILNSLDFLNQNSNSVIKNIKRSQPALNNSQTLQTLQNINSDDDADVKVIKSDSSVSSSFEENNEISVMNTDIMSQPEAISNFEFIIEKFTDLINIDNIELREIMDQISNQNQNNYDFSNVTQDSRMQQQIIPNVNRIKIEKVRALLWKQNKEQLIEEAKRKNKKLNASAMALNLEENSTDLELKSNGLNICPWSYYMENLFSKDDIFLYRGIIHFYCGRYNEAIQDFKQSNQIKKLHKLLDNQQNLNSDTESSEDDDQPDVSEGDPLSERQLKKDLNQTDESSHTDLSDIGLCSINRNERYFNILLCYIKLKKFWKAKKLIKKLAESCPEKYSKDILKIGLIISQWLKESLDKTNKKVTKNSIKPESIFIEPFAAEHRLCRFFPCVEFKYEGQNNKLKSFIARPSFSFPFVKPPNMIPNVDETLLHSEFGNQKSDHYIPQPQPLWIKIHADSNPEEDDQVKVAQQTKSRGLQHFQFTDNIVQQNDSFYQSQSQSQISSCISTLNKNAQEDQ